MDSDGPTALVLSRQSIPVLAGTAEAGEGVARGGYVLRRAPAVTPDIVLIGTGSEVSLCVEAAAVLAGPGAGDDAAGAPSVRARVVSLPSWDLFALQTDDVPRRGPAPRGGPPGVEAAASFGWERYADDVVAIDHFGASAPGAEVLEHFGYTPDNVAARARALTGPTGPVVAALTPVHSRVGRRERRRSEREGSTMTKLHDLYEQQGQSPWLDNLRRDYLRGGRLAELVDEGIRGVTSNPTIFAKAIEGGTDYDEQFGQLLADPHRRGGLLGARRHRHPRRPGCAPPGPRRLGRRRRLRVAGGGTEPGPRHRRAPSRRPGTSTSSWTSPTST